MYKKQNELWILEQFKQLYKEFPMGDIEESESPDFLIHTNGEIVGIEIAEIFQDSHLSKSSKLKQREIIQGGFGNTLLELLKSKLKRKTSFMLDIEFSIHHLFTKAQVNDLINQCWIPCMEVLWNNEVGFTRIENDGENLPKEINSIFIRLSKNGYEPFYCNNQGGGVDNLRFGHLERTLKKHEEALIKYKNCDEYWLIIREGNYYAGSFGEIDMNITIPINSCFDKVFIFRTRPSSNVPLIILK